MRYEIKKYNDFIEYENINESLKSWIAILAILYNTGFLPRDIKDKSINDQIEFVKKLPDNVIDSVKFINYIHNDTINDNDEYKMWVKFKKDNPDVKTNYEEFKKIRAELLYYDDLIIEVTYLVNIFIIISIFVVISLTLFKKIKNEKNDIELLKMYYNKIINMKNEMKKYNNKDIDKIYDKFMMIFDDYVNKYEELIYEDKLKKLIGIINNNRSDRIKLLTDYFRALKFLHKRWDFYVNCLEDIKEKLNKKELNELIECIYDGYNLSLELKKKYNLNINPNNPEVLINEVKEMEKIIDKIIKTHDKSLKYAIKLLDEYNNKRNKVLYDYEISKKYKNLIDNNTPDIDKYKDMINKCSYMLNNNKNKLTTEEYNKCLNIMNKAKKYIEICGNNYSVDKIHNEMCKYKKQIMDIINSASNKKKKHPHGL